MKKLKSTLILSGAMFSICNSCLAASSESTDNSVTYTKYIVIIIAVVIIALLLFLGFKMDTKEDGVSYSKPKKSKEKENEEQDVKYESDNVKYEDDLINPNDLSEAMEYEEDESSLFDTLNDNSESNNELDVINTEPEEEYGEEFDTSIIDDIEDEDDIVIPETSQETMIFNNPPVDAPTIDETVNNPIDDENVENEEPKVEDSENQDPIIDDFDENLIEDPLATQDSTENDSSDPIIEDTELDKMIDELPDNTSDDFIDEPSKKEDENVIKSIDNVDPLMAELSKAKEESNFEGFSVSNSTEKNISNDIIEEAPDNLISEEQPKEKTKRKYTKTKKNEDAPIVNEEDFMAQMEENLKKDKAERDAKKSKKTTKKKE